MQLEDIKKVTVLGAGIMGHGIAQAFLMGGYPVILYDIAKAPLEAARAHIAESMEMFREFDILTDQELADGMKRLSETTNLKTAVSDSEFIIEAAPEKLILKQDLFRQVESLCPPDSIIATNTSSFTLKGIGAEVENKTRLVTAHWFNPPQIVPVVEVVKGEGTSLETQEVTYALLQKINKVPVKINKDIPGFLVNRISGAITRELFHLYDQGVADAEDIDRAIVGTIGFQFGSIGPLRRMDLGGLALWMEGADRVFPILSNADKAPDALRRLVEAGHLGIRSGKGFYDYSSDFSEANLDEAILMRDREFLARLKRNYLSPQANDHEA